MSDPTIEDATLAAPLSPTLGTFLRALFADGSVTVLPVQAPVDEGDAALVIAEFEAAWRLEIPGEPPEFSPEVALWAAHVVHRLCQLLVQRDVGAEEAAKLLALLCPLPMTSSAAYSADLVFRFLPEIDASCRRMFPGDPLLEEVRRIGADWPLSSVGIAGVSSSNLEIVSSHPTLLRLYVDRVLAAGDTSRLNDPLVVSQVWQALGAFPDLAPAIKRHLDSADSSPAMKSSNA